MMRKKLVIMLFVLASNCGLIMAQQPAVMVSTTTGWHKIGSASVDFKTDRDEITVLGNDKFSKLKLRIEDAPVDLQDLEVYFENGTKQDVQVRTPMNPGVESREIDLDGGVRELKKVVFVYKTIGTNDTRANVVLYGFKPESGTTSAVNYDDRVKNTDVARLENNDRVRNPNTPTAMQDHPAVINDHKGWVKVGEANADLTKDRDVINITNYNRFTSIKFWVTGADLEIMDLNVWFANGEKQDISVRSMIKEGGESREIDLNGKNRDIKRIEFIYKTATGQGKDRAHVEVWAKGTMRDQKTTGSNTNTNNSDISNTANNGNAIPKPAVVMSDKKGWHKIGETVVSFKKETDEIAVLGADRFAKIKFKVEEAGIVINDMQIWYEDGKKEDIAVKATFNEGQESRVIDIPGREKDIKRITFTYHTIANQQKERAHVEIYGLKLNEIKNVGEVK